MCSIAVVTICFLLPVISLPKSKLLKAMLFDSVAPLVKIISLEYAPILFASRLRTLVISALTFSPSK